MENDSSLSRSNGTTTNNNNNNNNTPVPISTSLSLLTSVLMDNTDPRFRGSSSATGSLSASSSIASFSTASLSRRPSLLGDSSSEPTSIADTTLLLSKTTTTTMMPSPKSFSSSSYSTKESQHETDPSGITTTLGSTKQKQTWPVLPHKSKKSSAHSLTTTVNPNQLSMDQYWQVVRQQAITTATEEMFGMTMSDEEQHHHQLDDDTLRGITQRPSGAWQAQIYYAGKTRYIGCFEHRLTAARVYQLLREQLNTKKSKNNNNKTGQQQLDNLRNNKNHTAVESQVSQQTMELPNQTNNWTGSSSRSSSSSSMPPLKKRRFQVKEEEVTSEITSQKTGDHVASTSVDNAYQPPKGVSTPPPPSSSMQLQGRTPVLPHPGHGNSGGPYFYGRFMGYAPLLPPIRNAGPGLQQQQQQQQQQQPQPYPPQQQPMQMMMPPPPPSPFMGQFVPTMAVGFPPLFSHAVAMGQFQPCFPPSNTSTTAPPIGTMTATAAANSNSSSNNSNNNNKTKNRPEVLTKTNSTLIKSDPQKNAENETMWKAVRKEVLEYVKSGKADSIEPVPMDKELLRGITQRPSGKYQAQMYFAGQSRYIGVFQSKEEAAVAYELIRQKIHPRSKSAPKVTLSLSLNGNVTKAKSKQVALNKGGGGGAIKNRAITPSPTTVGGKHGRSFFGTMVVPAATSPIPIAPKGVVSPLPKTNPGGTCCTNKKASQVTPTHMGGSSSTP
ncbi:hypothetical protein IV203_012987 [Nitzschia inconspicua]|uniref:AP2/ERF domain-containing protein n=1 Tax=Nitzschia inconspicua TaxID=303405 RepID=A0A9K3M4H7_9STRA|nr:hypothetical protein IV203_012987 [Nitzschia inconspicua]